MGEPIKIALLGKVDPKIQAKVMEACKGLNAEIQIVESVQDLKFPCTLYMDLEMVSLARPDIDSLRGVFRDMAGNSEEFLQMNDTLAKIQERHLQSICAAPEPVTPIWQKRRKGEGKFPGYKNGKHR